VAFDQKKWTREIEEHEDKSNILGKILVVVGFAISIIALLGILYYGPVMASFIVAGLVVAGIGEIINLLQKIYYDAKYKKRDIQ